MATHNQLGKHAEEMAVNYLLQNEYEILFRNWRYSYYEIDIVAKKKNILHIIEVKCLNDSSFGNPEDSVTKKKFRYLLNAADEFLFQHPEYKWVQYDILSITLFKHKEAEYFLIKNVYL